MHTEWKFRQEIPTLC